jgi:hypothetical protein
MSRPGVEVTSAAAAPPLGVPTDTSVLFVVGEAAMGPTDAPTRLTSLDDFTNVYGARVPASYSYDALDAYFHEGGASVYFQRFVDDDAKLATGDATSIVAGATLTAANAGAWADELTVSVDDTPGGTTRASKGKNAPARPALLTYSAPQAAGAFMATVSLGSTILAVSQPLDTAAELAEFLAGPTASPYVTYEGPTDSTAVAKANVTLTGGADGAIPVTGNDADAIVDALAALTSTLGPGQVCAPGRSDENTHAAILAHCAATTRYALLDCALHDDSATCISAAAVLRGAEEDRYGMLWAPWAVIPGLAPGTRRTIPWSTVQAALCARNDLAGNPNQAAAGGWGQTQYVVDLADHFTEPGMEAMLYAGVCTARLVYGVVEAYAFRSLVDPNGPRSEWLQANWGRLSMAITADSDAVGEDYVFSQIDGRGLTIAAFNGALSGVCKAYVDDGALYVDPNSNGDPTTAYVVNTGPAVNTEDSKAQGILKAVLSVRMSPHAELVQIQIVKYPITVALA